MSDTDRLLPAVLDTVGEGIITIDAISTIVLVNQEVQRIWGYTKDELIGQNVEVLMPEQYRAAHAAGIQRYLRTRVPRILGRGVELEGLTKNGTVFPLELHIEETRVGERQFFTAAISDLTERRRAIAALSESELRYRILVETAPVLIWMSGPEQLRTYVNNTWLTFTRRPIEAELGDGWLALVHPDDRERYLATYTSAFDARQPFGIEYRLRRWDGEYRWMLDQCLPRYTDTGAFAGYIAACVDTTDHKRAAEALRQYAELLKHLRRIDQSLIAIRSPQVISEAALSVLCQLVPCQRASITVFDFETRQAAVLASYPSSARPSRREDGIPISDNVPIETLRQGEVLVVNDVPSRKPKPSLLRFLGARNMRSLLSVPLFYEGQLFGSLNIGANTRGAYKAEHIDIVRDVTGQLATAIQNARLFEQMLSGHDRLRTLLRHLISAQEDERRTIARKLHDEINQVLAAVKINLQVVQQLSHAPARAGQLEQSIGVVDLAIGQVRDLSLGLRPALLDDLGLLSALRWYVDRLARQSGLSVWFDADPIEVRLPDELETACFRVAQEALVNVRRHAHATRVDVELRLGETELRLVIRDDGVGFDVRAAQERAASGTNLGLLEMQERVLLAGGTLRIDSAPARGTEVHVRFPLSAVLQRTV